MAEKLSKNWISRGLKLRWFRQNQKMTSIIKLAFEVILRVNYLRIWTPPTQFQKLKNIS